MHAMNATWMIWSEFNFFWQPIRRVCDYHGMSRLDCHPSCIANQLSNISHLNIKLFRTINNKRMINARLSTTIDSTTKSLIVCNCVQYPEVKWCGLNCFHFFRWDLSFIQW